MKPVPKERERLMVISSDDARRYMPQATVLTVVSAILFAVAAWLLSQTLSNLDRPTSAVVWGGVALAAYCAGLLCLVNSVRGAGLELARWKFGPWVLIWCGITYGVATVTWSQPQTGIATQIALASVLRALWLVGIGLTAWAIGYFIGAGRVISNLAERGVGVLDRHFSGQVRSLMAPWMLYAVGSLARIAAAATSGQFDYLGNPSLTLTSAVTGYGQILRILGLCAPLAVAAASMQVFQEHLSGARVTLAVLFPVELGISIASGLKANFLVLALAIIIPYGAARNRLPKGVIVFVLVTLLGVVIPFTVAYRTVVRNGQSGMSTSEALAVAPKVLAQVATVSNVTSSFSVSFGYLFQRVSEIETPAIIVQRTPTQIPFQSPVYLIEEPLYGFIPRAVWSGKPVSSPAYQVSLEFFGIKQYNAVAPTPIGGLYQMAACFR